MKHTITEQTNEYIKEHPFIISCLRRDLINYSSLARTIANDLQLDTPKDAILIAARRYRERLKKEESKRERVRTVLSRSEVTVRNKIVTFIIDKQVNFEKLENIQKEIKEKSGTIYIIEGSDHYTIITQEAYAKTIEKLSHHIVGKTTDSALIILKSPKEIEKASGVVAYLTALFAENGVNILEFLSCWTDTLFVVKAKDIPKAMQFLQF